MKHTKVLFLALLCLGYSVSSCNKDDLNIENPADLEEYLAEEMDFQNIPALSVLLFEKQEVLYQNQLGSANLQQNIPLQSNHLFLLASVSKMITATTLLQLYGNGEFELSDNINDYLPFNVTNPSTAGTITFKMLLTHTSSIADGSVLDNHYYYGEDSPVELGFFIEEYLTPNGQFYNATENYHAFSPGTDVEYSNVGNALIAVLVEQISGLAFNTYCKQHIFEPLQMNDTYWRLDEISQTIVQPYNYENGSYQSIEHYTFTDYPNGGLRSTASDLHKFMSAIALGGALNGFRLLEAQTVQQMHTPQITNLDTETGLHMFKLNAEHNLWGHDGGEQGVATIAAFNPSNGIGAIILSNQGDADLDEMLSECYLLATKL